MLLWLIIGLIVASGLIWLVLWLRRRDIKVTWYEWLIGAIGLLMLLFTIQNFVGSIVEEFPNVAYMFLLVFGLPALILIAVAASLVWRRQSTAS